MPGDRPYWVALNHVRGIGAARVRRLKENFATLHDAWHAPRHELLAAGLDERSTESLCEERERLDPEALLATIEARGIEVLTWGGWGVSAPAGGAARGAARAVRARRAEPPR